MGAELFDWLVRATLAISVATAGVLVARPLWRRAFGPAGVLWPWLLVPALLVAVSVPRPARVVEAPAEVVLQDVAHRSPPMASGPAASASTAAPGLSVRDRLRPYAAALVATWLGGAVVLALALARRQRRFRRALEPLRPRADGSYASSAIGIGPVLVGVLRPRIVVPADFELRFDASQRTLVLEHERVHLRRGDLQMSLLAAALRCVFWFDPLVHLAAARLRVDQELACDAAVLRRHPSAGRDYATALLNSQLAVPGLPVGCGWQSSHPLKWRIQMLRQPIPGFARLFAGAGLALAASSVAAVTAWQSQPQAVVVAVAPVAVAVDASAATAAVDPIVVVAPAPAVVPEPVIVPDIAAVPGIAVVPDPAPAPEPAPAVAPVPAVAPRVSPVPAVEPVVELEVEPIVAPAVEPATEPFAVSVPEPAPEPGATAAPASDTPASAPTPPRVARLHLADPPRRARDRDLDAEQDARMIVSVEVDADGRPHDARVVETNLGRAYRASALRAVTQWEFEPARENGRAVAATVLVPVMFDLEQIPVEHAEFAGFRHPRPIGPPVSQPAAPPAR